MKNMNKRVTIILVVVVIASGALYAYLEYFSQKDSAQLRYSQTGQYKLTSEKFCPALLNIKFFSTFEGLTEGPDGKTYPMHPTISFGGRDPGRFKYTINDTVTTGQYKCSNNGSVELYLLNQSKPWSVANFDFSTQQLIFENKTFYIDRSDVF